MHQLNSTAPQYSRRVSSGVTFIRPKCSTNLRLADRETTEAYAAALQMVAMASSWLL